MIKNCMIFEGFLYCLGSIVAQAILDYFVAIFVHLRTTENTVVKGVNAVKNIAIMSMDAYRVNVISGY